MLSRPKGQPHTAQTFRAMFYREIGEDQPLAKIGETGLSPHGLRVLAVNTLLELGLTPTDVAGVTGQSIITVESYGRQRNQRKIDDRAMAAGGVLTEQSRVDRRLTCTEKPSFAK